MAGITKKCSFLRYLGYPDSVGMQEHIKILGILNIVLGSLTAVAGLCVLLIFGGAGGLIAAAAHSADSDLPSNLAAPAVFLIGVAIAGFLLVLSLPAIVGGWGLLKFRPWSRVLMIVVSVFHLLHFPLGTALGVYGIWALMSEPARQLLQNGGVLPAYPPQPV
jgi:hypothetical protein